MSSRRSSTDEANEDSPLKVSTPQSNDDSSRLESSGNATTDQLSSLPLSITDTPKPPNVFVDRYAYSQPVFDERFKKGPYSRSTRDFAVKSKDYLAEKAKTFSCLQFLVNRLPILTWLPRYRWKEDFIHDVIAGFTVAVMHIPQGLAYGLLAQVPAICGLYTAFFPVLVYMFLGTSRHISMGTLAITSILMSKSVIQITSTNPEHCDNSNVTSSLNASVNSSTAAPPSQEECLTDLEVAIAVTMTVGLVQILAGLLHLGCLSSLLSNALLSGFTTGASIHVLTSQVKHILGLKVKPVLGIFKIVKTYIAIFSRIEETNLATLGLSASCITVLVIYEELVKPRIAKKIKFPIPIQLIVMVLGTIISYAMDLKGQENVNVVGAIPTGFPEPVIPPMYLFPRVLLDSFIVAVIGYVISLSLAKIIAARHNYKVDATQELLAQGTSNVFGSFFSSIAMTSSLSRSLVQEVSGGRTQMTSAVSCFLLLWVILYVGPVFETLPTSVMASIIVVALKGMFKQILDLRRFGDESPVDGLIWTCTFLGTVFLDIDIGLAIGACLSLLFLFLWGCWPNVRVLNTTEAEDLLVDAQMYQAKSQDSGTTDEVLIIKLYGNINFSNSSLFSKKLTRQVESTNEATKLKEDFEIEKPDCYVIDMSGVSSVDPTGAKMLGKFFFNNEVCQDRKTVFTGVNHWCWFQLDRSAVLDEIPENRFFPTVQDAVAFHKSDRNTSKST